MGEHTCHSDGRIPIFGFNNYFYNRIQFITLWSADGEGARNLLHIMCGSHERYMFQATQAWATWGTRPTGFFWESEQKQEGSIELCSNDSCSDIVV